MCKSHPKTAWHLLIRQTSFLIRYHRLNLLHLGGSKQINRRESFPPGQRRIRGRYGCDRVVCIIILPSSNRLQAPPYRRCRTIRGSRASRYKPRTLSRGPSNISAIRIKTYSTKLSLEHMQPPPPFRFCSCASSYFPSAVSASITLPYLHTAELLRAVCRTTAC